MRLGLGLAMTLPGGAAFSPASLNWGGLWTASFSASPWVGTASAGSSGSRNLTEATNPPATGTAQNGLVPADFNGTNSQLLTGLAWSSFITATDFFFDAIFVPDTTVAATTYDADASIIGDGSGFCGIAITNDGFTVYASSGGTLKTRTVARTLGSYSRVQARLTAGDLAIRKDGGAWSATINVGTITSIADVVRVGKNFNSTKFMDGRLLHLGMSATSFSDAVADQIDTYNKARFGL